MILNVFKSRCPSLSRKEDFLKLHILKVQKVDMNADAGVKVQTQFIVFTHTKQGLYANFLLSDTEAQLNISFTG